MDSDEHDGFRSSSHPESRDLTENEVLKLAKQDTVTPFKQNKLEIEAQANWDRFYNRNKDNFFKDRNWSSQDMQELCSDLDFSSKITYLEAGCGVGNMLFPLAATYPNLKLQGFDFSKNAVSLLKSRALELQISVESAVIDLTQPLERCPFSEEADLATLIFVLSAIHPDKQQEAVNNMTKFIKIGGSVVVRDYGINDFAMIRFGRGAKLSDRFYARQDGTRAFYFKTEELVGLFENAGFETRQSEYLHRQTINHQKSLNVPRIFVQARFVRVK